MDLATLLARVDERRYGTPAAFLADVAAIVTATRQYLGDLADVGDLADAAAIREEVSRAHALENEARALLTARVPPELWARCDEIAAAGGPAPPPPPGAVGQGGGSISGMSDRSGSSNDMNNDSDSSNDMSDDCRSSGSGGGSGSLGGGLGSDLGGDLGSDGNGISQTVWQQLQALLATVDNGCFITVGAVVAAANLALGSDFPALDEDAVIKVRAVLTCLLTGARIPTILPLACIIYNMLYIHVIYGITCIISRKPPDTATTPRPSQVINHFSSEINEGRCVDGLNFAFARGSIYRAGTLGRR